MLRFIKTIIGYTVIMGCMLPTTLFVAKISHDYLYPLEWYEIFALCVIIFATMGVSIGIGAKIAELLNLISD